VIRESSHAGITRESPMQDDKVSVNGGCGRGGEPITRSAVHSPGQGSGCGGGQCQLGHQRVRIPTKSAGDSERRRPPIPIEAGRGFR
jgi:hypothetical protein